MTIPENDHDPGDADARLAAALRHVADGRKVFPCIPGGKTPLTTHGFHDASDDPSRIMQWHRRYPNSNWGLSTGTGSFDVLDVDVHESGNGYASMTRLLNAGLLRAARRIVLTRSLGLHIYLLPSCGNRNASLPAHHLDVRGDGGYVLIEDCMVGGSPYVLLADNPAATGTLDWAACRKLLDPPRPVQAVHRPAGMGVGMGSLGGIAKWLAAQRQPGRNNALFWAVRTTVENGGSRTDVERLARIACDIGLEPQEIAATVRSASRITEKATP